MNEITSISVWTAFGETAVSFSRRYRNKAYFNLTRSSIERIERVFNNLSKNGEVEILIGRKNVITCLYPS